MFSWAAGQCGNVKRVGSAIDCPNYRRTDEWTICLLAAYGFPHFALLYVSNVWKIGFAGIVVVTAAYSYSPTFPALFCILLPGCCLVRVLRFDATTKLLISIHTYLHLCMKAISKYSLLFCVCVLGFRKIFQYLFTMYFALCAYYAHALARIADSTHIHNNIFT